MKPLAQAFRSLRRGSLELHDEVRQRLAARGKVVGQKLSLPRSHRIKFLQRRANRFRDNRLQRLARGRRRLLLLNGYGLRETQQVTRSQSTLDEPLRAGRLHSCGQRFCERLVQGDRHRRRLKRPGGNGQLHPPTSDALLNQVSERSL